RTITCDKCGIQTATEIQPFNVITLNLPVTSTTFFTKIQKGSQHLSTASLDEKGKGTSQDPASMLAFTDATLAERASLEHRSSTALPPPPVSSSSTAASRPVHRADSTPSIFLSYLLSSFVAPKTARTKCHRCGGITMRSILNRSMAQ
ncbi:hypothetical protein ADUPG1_004058, partial [Aduncisulcus paluster]